MRRIAIATAAIAAAAGVATAAETTMLQLMKATIDPAANAFWAAGNDPPEGESSEDAEARWLAAVKGAELMETYGELLLQPAHSRGAEWDAFAHEMAKAGADGRTAAERRDMDAAFEAGGRLYESCAGCHARFIPGR